MTTLPNFDPVIGMSPYLSHTNGRAKPKLHPMKMRDEEGHRAMQAAGKAWKAIKTHSTKTWTEWTEVIGPGLVKAQAEARSVSNKPSGKGYNTAMGALLEEYGFGNAVERFRSKVTRADLLHCMDYLTEIEAWRHKADASVLEPVERKQNHRYPDHTTLNHPTVVWRRFATSVDGKQAFKDRGIEPKPRAPKPTTDIQRDLADARAHIAELEAARPAPVESAAEPTADSAAEPTASMAAPDLDASLRGFLSGFHESDAETKYKRLQALASTVTQYLTRDDVNDLILSLQVADTPDDNEKARQFADGLKAGPGARARTTENFP
jgi:hypothetical protein